MLFEEIELLLLQGFALALQQYLFPAIVEDPHECFVKAYSFGTTDFQSVERS